MFESRISARKIEGKTMPVHFKLTSDAFESGGTIPKEYTCSGKNVSPLLRWENPPEGTKSLTLIMDDPDAPRKTFVHWVIFNLPVEPNVLPSGVDPSEHYQNSEIKPVEGVNDFGSLGYGGPCPPPGRPHRYYFRLYALDTVLDLSSGATRQQVTDAMAGHILEELDYMGTFGR